MVVELFWAASTRPPRRPNERRFRLAEAQALIDAKPRRRDREQRPRTEALADGAALPRSREHTRKNGEWRAAHELLANHLTADYCREAKMQRSEGHAAGSKRGTTLLGEEKEEAAPQRKEQGQR